LEEATLAQEARIEENEKVIEETRQDFDEISNAAISGAGGTTGPVTGMKTFEMLSKIRDAESRIKDIGLRFDVQSTAFSDQLHKTKELIDKATIDSANSLNLA
jgi:hypothetical protein